MEISVQKDVKELLLNEWQLLGGVNAPKGSLKKLADKYNINDNTVRRWKAEHLKKNITNVRKEQTNKRTAKSRDIQIKKDILNDVPREEVMEKHGIKKSAYYVKEKSIRELVKNRNKIIFESVSDRLISDKEERLIRYKTIKLELLDKIEEAMLDNESYDLKQLNDKLNLLTKAEKELYKELRLKVTYEESEFEKQLAEEETQRNRLEIEKLKQGTEEDKKVEIKIIGVD